MQSTFKSINHSLILRVISKNQIQPIHTPGPPRPHPSGPNNRLNNSMFWGLQRGGAVNMPVLTPGLTTVLIQPHQWYLRFCIQLWLPSPLCFEWENVCFVVKPFNRLTHFRLWWFWCLIRNCSLKWFKERLLFDLGAREKRMFEV